MTAATLGGVNANSQTAGNGRRGKARRFLIDACLGHNPKLIQKNGPQNRHQKIKLITYYHIINYDGYQLCEHQNGHQPDIKRTSNGTRIIKENKCNKEKAGIEEKKPPAPFIKKNGQNQKEVKNGNFEKMPDGVENVKNAPNEKTGIFDETPDDEKNGNFEGYTESFKEKMTRYQNRWPKHCTNAALTFEVRELLESTRAGGKVADSVFENFMDFCERFPAFKILAAIKKFKEGGHAEAGKDEKYLKGIIRNMTDPEAKKTLEQETKPQTSIDWNEPSKGTTESFLEMNRRLWREQGKNY